VFSDERFDSAEEAENWINSTEGYLFAQDVMINIDVSEYLGGYWLEKLDSEAFDHKITNHESLKVVRT
jgi:hypothetical protein